MELRQHPREQIAWREAALYAARRLANRKAEAKLLKQLSDSFSEIGEQGQALDYAEQALKIMEELGDLRGVGVLSNRLGLIQKDWGNFSESMDLFKRALKIFRVLKDEDPNEELNEGKVNGNLGNLYSSMGKYDEAMVYYDAQYTIARKLGHKSQESNALNDKGLALYDRGETQEAVELFQKAYLIRKSLKARKDEAGTLNNLGMALTRSKHIEKALNNFAQALGLARRFEYKRLESDILGNQGIAYREAGKPRIAIGLFEEQLEISSQLHFPRGIGNANSDMGFAYLSLKQVKKVELPRKSGHLKAWE